MIKEIELRHGIIKVSLKYLDKLIEKYNNGKNFKKEELNNFFSYDLHHKKWIACFNEDGNCFVEEFNHLRSVIRYLATDMDLETIQKLDEEGATE